MDYFIMCQDRQLQNLPGLRLSNDIKRDNISEIPATMIFYVEEKRQVEYPDYLQKPVKMISGKLKEILSKYQPDIVFTTAVLIEKAHNKQMVYYVMDIPEVDCRWTEPDIQSDNHLEEFVVDAGKIGSRRIFCAKDYGNRMIVRLDAVESILRRNAYGIWFEKIETRR